MLSRYSHLISWLPTLFHQVLQVFRRVSHCQLIGPYYANQMSPEASPACFWTPFLFLTIMKCYRQLFASHMSQVSKPFHLLFQISLRYRVLILKIYSVCNPSDSLLPALATATLLLLVILILTKADQKDHRK